MSTGVGTPPSDSRENIGFASAEQAVILVTGSTGLIGQAVLERLAGRYRLVGFDRDLPPHPLPVAECVCIDLASDASVEAALTRVRTAYGERIASVVHLAAYFDLTGKPDPRYEQVTVRGTGRLLRGLQAFEVGQFVFTSTMLVHAPRAPGERIDEDWPLDPKLPYRASKVRTEALLSEQRGDIPVAVIRPAGVYDDRCHNAFLSHQIARIYERSLPGHLYPGDPDVGQSFLHLDDLVDAIDRLIERRADLGPKTTLLLGEQEPIGYAALQRRIGCLIRDEPWRTWTMPPALARAGAWLQADVLGEEPFVRPWMVDIANDHYALDISRARDVLGWEPTRSLPATLPIMIEALQRDPVGWYEANKLNSAIVAGDAAMRQEETPHGQEHGDMKHEMGGMHANMPWVHFTVVGLGAWLLASPFQFALFDPAVLAVARDVTLERGLADPATRNALTGVSELVSGMLLLLFGAMSLSRRFGGAPWGTTCVGLWLLAAPILFWAPSAAAYTNDTIVGTLAVALSVLIPMMPGMSHAGMMDESTVPPGWTYSPSSWLQRLPIIALGLFGFLIARILTAYQLGHIAHIPEPFFSGADGKNGSEYIITSSVSRAWPIPDAGLGAYSYMLEVLMGAMGSVKRWRTMPWMVTFFFILVVPLGGVSIVFIIIQPIVIGTYCTLCLLTAVAMLIMIPLALDEVVAMGQYMRRCYHAGRPLIRTFLQGGPDPAATAPRETGFDAPVPQQLAQAVRGVTAPWTLLASCGLGVWLIFTRATFGATESMADSDHLMGALVVTVAVIAMAEVARPLRFLNVLFGLWLSVAPLLLAGLSGPAAAVNGIVVGLLLIAFSLPRGRRSGAHYGGWDRFVV